MMLGRKDYALREAYSLKFIEAVKQNPNKFDQKLQEAEEAIRCFRPLCDEKQREKLLYDMLYCDVCFGASNEEYFLYDFEHLSNAKRDQFVTDRVRMQFYQTVNQFSSAKLLNDKYEAYLRFQKYYRRDVLKIHSVADLPAFIEFVAKHHKFIMKPNNLYGGKGICIFDAHKADISDIFAQLLSYKGGVVIEELVKQSAQMNALNDSCLNTVRIVTAYFSDHVEIHFTALRCGDGTSIVDNFCLGGMFSLIERETGRLISPFADRNRNFCHQHPHSHIFAKDFHLPQWDCACDLAKELATLIPDNRVVGWDLAHTEDGWIMIEGNGCPQLGAQISAGEGWMATFEDLQERLIRDMGEPCHW